MEFLEISSNISASLYIIQLICLPPGGQFSSQLIESMQGRIAVIGTGPNPLDKACEGRIATLSQLPYKSKPCPIRSAIWSRQSNEISHLLSEPSVDAKPNWTPLSSGEKTSLNTWQRLLRIIGSNQHFTRTQRKP